MADKVTETTHLAVNFGFVDGDTRTAKVPNPREDLTASEVADVNATLLTNKLIVGDKAGAEFSGILTADKVIIQQTKYDI